MCRSDQNLQISLAVKLGAGYRSTMTLKAFCTTCQRTVYVDGNDTPVCPVCSSPLLETIESREEVAEDTSQD